ncbi:MAG: hypothetical protein ACFCVA_04380 [Gammaproteobacteria bacterium]
MCKIAADPIAWLRTPQDLGREPDLKVSHVGGVCQRRSSKLSISAFQSGPAVVARPILGTHPFRTSFQLFKKMVPDDFVAAVRLAPALATFL